MAYKSHFTPRAHSSASSKKGAKTEKVNGRVVKAVLSLSDPDCKDSSMLNGVFYRVPKHPSDESVDTGLGDTVFFAKQGNSSVRVIPMEGEFVEVVFDLGANSITEKVAYWNKVVNVWNHPSHNASPDTKQTDWQDRLLGGAAEQAVINPLQANPGDTLFEGRLGQSIRFGGYKGAHSTNIDSSNNGKPIIIISNGQIKTTNGNDPIYEDINEDFSSMHFVSDHIVPLKPANKERGAYDTPPIAFDKYIGNQIILNAGRVVLNAKEESLFLSAKESVGINAKTVNIDASDFYCVDAKRIYLGKKARAASAKEPVILGTQLENWLVALLDTLSSVSTAMQTATSVSGGPVTQLNLVGPELASAVSSLKAQIKLFQSKKVFTE